MSAYLVSPWTVGALAGLASSAKFHNRHSTTLAPLYDLRELVDALMIENERSLQALYGKKASVYSEEQKAEALQIARKYEQVRFPTLDGLSYAPDEAILAAKYLHVLGALFSEWDYQSCEHPESTRTGWYSWVELLVKQIKDAYLTDMGRVESGWVDREEVAEYLGV